MSGEVACRRVAGPTHRALVFMAVGAFLLLGAATAAALPEPAGRSDAGLLDFLSRAEIVDDVRIGIGTTGMRKLTLEGSGARMYAAYRDVDTTYTSVRLRDGCMFRRVRDYAGHEVAAYRLSLLLQMDSVPPAEHRVVRGRPGTVQVWIQGAMMDRKRVQEQIAPPSALHWFRQRQEMILFDELVGNIDRTQENILIDQDWKIWLIDHTRAFQQGDRLHEPERISVVRRAFWDAMRALDRDAVARAVGEDVRADEVDELMARRDLLVAHISGLIAERGESAVLWE